MQVAPVAWISAPAGANISNKDAACEISSRGSPGIGCASRSEPCHFGGVTMTTQRRALIFACYAAVILCRAQGQQYVISTYAGGPQPSGAKMTVRVLSVAADAAGNIYFSTSY